MVDCNCLGIKGKTKQMWTEVVKKAILGKWDLSLDLHGLGEGSCTLTQGAFLGRRGGHWLLFHNGLLAVLLTGLWNSWGLWFCLFYLPHPTFGGCHPVNIQLRLWVASISQWINENILIRGKTIIKGTVMGISIIRMWVATDLSWFYFLL